MSCIFNKSTLCAAFLVEVAVMPPPPPNTSKLFEFSRPFLAEEEALEDALFVVVICSVGEVMTATLECDT